MCDKSHFCCVRNRVPVKEIIKVDYFVVIEIAFMDNQAQITETISRLDSERVS